MRHALALALLAGCSCGGPEAPVAGAPSSRAPDTEAPDPEAPDTAAADYEVHEWGLLRATADDALSAGAIGPPRAVTPITVDKPVLYFHTSAPFVLRRAEVDTRGGRIVEAWPPARSSDPSRLVWTDVRIDPSGACAPSPLPTLRDPACTRLGPGEVCEVAALAIVRTDEAACVRTAEHTDSMLFYRERTRGLTPPLRFERTSTYEVVEVTNEGTSAIPGWLVRLHDDGTSVRALAVRPPAPGQRITVGADFAAATVPRADDEVAQDRAAVDGPALPGSPEPGRAAIRATVRELGLTEAEADAFLRAWDPTLFAVTTDGRFGAIDVLTADGDPAPRESFLYFLPEADCERVSHLTLDPPPRAIRRALALWSPLRASGASR
ncbi:MAG: hypothetical protein KF729_06155 [Sandaracinaceae bacterium]|nr:hypothetical protein [Sandaracinaceae bacterium]